MELETLVNDANVHEAPVNNASVRETCECFGICFGGLLHHAHPRAMDAPDISHVSALTLEFDVHSSRVDFGMTILKFTPVEWTSGCPF